MKKKFFLLFTAIIVSINYAHAKTSDSLDVKLNLYQKIKMSDGINLSSNIYIPTGVEKKYPTILIITPYISDENHSRGLFFSRNGYVFITVDSRGRGNSEGEFVPFENDAKDGFDIVNWIAKQKWSNGKVGMLGGSYRGTAQWLTLKHLPENLKTIIPIASVRPGRDFPKYNNIFSVYSLRWLMFTGGKTYNGELFGEDFWAVKREKMYTNGIAFNKYDSIVGASNKTFQKWLSHPSQDEFWKAFYLSPDENKRINIPILSITGHFDGDQFGALQYYKDHDTYGNENAKKNHYLIIGPWNHGGTRNPKSKLSGLTFGENAVIDMNSLYLNWFNWTLKNKEKPALLKDRVMFYEMGNNLWRYASNLDAISDSNMHLYLSSQNSEAKSVFSSGNLLKTPLKKDLSADQIVYNPSLKEGISNPSYTSEYSFTNQSYLNDANILIYHSLPLEKDITVNGSIKLEAYISMDVEDTDLRFSAYEITKDNTSIFLQNDFLRARYRDGLEAPKKVPKDKIVKYMFSGRNLFSRTIKKGSRIRVVFSAIDSPSLQKNYNYWIDTSKQVEKNSKKANIKLYHNTKYPSRIIVPYKQDKKQAKNTSR